MPPQFDHRWSPHALNETPTTSALIVESSEAVTWTLPLVAVTVLAFLMLASTTPLIVLTEAAPAPASAPVVPVLVAPAKAPPIDSAAMLAVEEASTVISPAASTIEFSMYAFTLCPAPISLSDTETPADRAPALSIARTGRRDGHAAGIGADARLVLRLHHHRAGIDPFAAGAVFDVSLHGIADDVSAPAPAPASAPLVPCALLPDTAPPMARASIV